MAAKAKKSAARKVASTRGKKPRKKTLGVRKAAPKKRIAAAKKKIAAKRVRGGTKTTKPLKKAAPRKIAKGRARIAKPKPPVAVKAKALVVAGPLEVTDKVKGMFSPDYIVFARHVKDGDTEFAAARFVDGRVRTHMHPAEGKGAALIIGNLRARYTTQWLVPAEFQALYERMARSGAWRMLPAEVIQKAWGLPINGTFKIKEKAAA